MYSVKKYYVKLQFSVVALGTMMVFVLVKEVVVKHAVDVCFRVLLTVVAVLSSYSIHLLLKSSGIVGTYSCSFTICTF